MSNQLPFSQDLSGGMSNLSALIQQLNTQQAPQGDLSAVGNLANQQSVLRGLTGPLAASLANQAQGSYIQDFQRNKNQQLQGLLGLQGTLGLQLQDAEQRRRMLTQAALQQKADAERKDRQGVFGAVGGGLGALAGILIPGAQPFIPALAGLGSAAGGALEGGLTSAGVFGAPSYY